MTIVSVVQCDPAQKRESWLISLTRLLAPLGGLEFFLEPNAQPLIYIGRLWPAALEAGLNPAPELLTALCALARGAGAPGLLVAGRAAPDLGWPETLERAGYAELVEAGVTFCDLAQAPAATRQSGLNLAVNELAVPLPLLQSGCVINLSKFRVADGMLFGSAFLNLEAAAVLPAERAHKTRAMLDLLSVLQPDLQLVDASHGHLGYQPQQADAPLAARDTLGVDLVLAALAGLDAAEIAYLGLAAQYGLGDAHVGDIHLVGDDLRAIFGLPEQISENHEEQLD